MRQINGTRILLKALKYCKGRFLLILSAQMLERKKRTLYFMITLLNTCAHSKHCLHVYKYIGYKFIFQTCVRSQKKKGKVGENGGFGGGGGLEYQMWLMACRFGSAR